MSASWATAKVVALILAVVAAVGLSAIPPKDLLAQGPGVVAGQVTNGTPDGGDPAGSTVTLAAFLGSAGEIERRSTVSAEGAFRFDALETGAAWSYEVVVEYGAAQFSSGLFSFDGEAAIDRPIRVFETADQDPGVRVSRRLLVFTPSADRSLRVLEVVTVQNPGQAAFIAASTGPAALRFALPDGAFDFLAMWGFRAQDATVLPDGLILRTPLLPGENHMSFTYSFPWDPAGTAFSARLALPADEVIVMAPVGKLDVTSSALERSGESTIEGRELSVWRSKAPVALGGSIELSVRDPNLAPLARIARTSSGRWGAIMVGLALASLAVYGASRLRGAGGRKRPVTSAERANELLRRMAECDGPGAGGEGLEPRRAYKAELLDLLKSDPQLAEEILTPPGQQDLPPAS